MTISGVLIASAAILAQTPGETVLGVQGDRFTLNGTPTFLLGFSYYGALGAEEKTIRADLGGMQKLGVNWIRVWATWAAFDHDVSAVDVEGRPREMYLKKLARLVAECDRRGMVVDVTLSRGNGVTGPKRLQTLEAHERAVTAIVEKLRPHRNWYLDLGNERSIKDARFVSFADLKTLRALVKKLDPARLVTASAAGDIPQAEIKDYLDTGIDFLTPHRPRHAKSAAQTEAMTRSYRKWLKEAGRIVPVHYQEPFRRGFGKYDPGADDFWTDLEGARQGGAAGWCFHNGDQRAHKDGRPRRSFDLRNGPLFAQLDETERSFLKRLAVSTDSDAAKQQAALEGEWKAVAFEESGDGDDERLVKTMSWVFRGNRFTWHAEGHIECEGTYSLPPTDKTQPRAIDLRDERRKADLVGIYELDGDTLRIRFHTAKEPRPSRFTTSRDSRDHFLIVLRRVKK